MYLVEGRNAQTDQASASPDPANAARCLGQVEEPFGALADAEMFLNTFYTYISLDFNSEEFLSRPWSIMQIIQQW